MKKALLCAFLVSAAVPEISPRLASQELQVVQAVTIPALELTQDERKAIEAGKTLVRENPNKSLGGTAITLIRAPLWKVWQVITDFSKYPEFMPRNLESTILRSEGTNVLYLKSVYRGAFPFPKIWNESKVEMDYANPEQVSLTWVAQKTNLDFNNGYWKLEPKGNDTVATYHNNFEIPWVPQALARSSAQNSLVNTLDAVRAQTKNAQYERYPSSLTPTWLRDTPAQNLQVVPGTK